MRLSPVFGWLRPLNFSPFVPCIRWTRATLSLQAVAAERAAAHQWTGRGTMWMGPSDNKQETAGPSSLASSLTFLSARIAFGFMSSWWHYGVQLYPAWNSWQP